MGYTLVPASISFYGVTPTGSYNYSGRTIGILPIIDPAAAGTQILPIRQLITQFFLMGKMPLWNPYQALGTPLAADTVNSAYAPVNLLHFLPSAFWDVPILLRLWLAGLFMYAFLRNHKLFRDSAFVGAILYMLSGAFTWYISMEHLNVIMLTPLVLLSVDRIITGKHARVNICLASIVIALSLLGAHIEAIILQFCLVIIYYIYRVLGVNIRSFLGSSLRIMFSFAMGFGLAAFLLIPVFEYLANSSLAHTPDAGLVALLPYSAITSFIPYFFGLVQSYTNPSIGQVVNWNLLGGYVGVCALYLSLIAVIPHKKNFDKDKQRFAYFFLAMAIIALLITYGAPPFQWIGYLPVFNLILYPRYLGLVWCFGFSVAAAVGFEKLLGGNISRKQLKLAFGIASLSLITLALVSIPFPLTPGSLSFFPSEEKLAIILAPTSFFYSMERIIEGFAFLCTVTLLSLTLLNDRKMSIILIGLIVVEMAYYTPQGMSYQWELYRSLLILSTLAIIAFLLIGRRFIPSLNSLNYRSGISMRPSTQKILLLVLLGSLIIQNVIVGVSPHGLPHRSNAFEKAPYISFLQENSEFSRIYTFDGTYPPPLLAYLVFPN